MDALRRLGLNRGLVLLAALSTLVLRLSTVGQPLRPDEAGFLLVARSWAPSADSLYGPYFVDRPPMLIALVRLTDAVAGAVGVRLLGAVACTVFVLLAAGAAREVADSRAARWTALAAAALSCNAMIDQVSVKGEVLALPLLMGGCWAALVGVRRDRAGLLLLAGLLGGLALGLKQNLGGSLVFTLVLLVLSWRAGRLGGRRALGLGTLAGVGAGLPALASVGWALAAGVRLSTLVYAVAGFRSDAAQVIATEPTAAPERRALELVAIAVGAGMVLLAAGLVRHLREAWSLDAPSTGATVAMLLADGAGLVLGGSFWSAYLLPLLPGLALTTALLTRALWRRPDHRRQMLRTVVIGAVASTLVSVGVAAVLRTLHPDPEVAAGAAIGRVAEPGDTLTVFGGDADLQYASGLASPYAYLWSLPMRVLDPTYVDLVALVDGAGAPTWFVVAVPLSAWGGPDDGRLGAALEARYTEHGRDCLGRPVLLLDGVERPALPLTCG